eukprot:Sspe_Gene.79728::Locus_50057_Transcript_1_1_Confidence_1.000_Length_985::g.79728::m.79728
MVVETVAFLTTKESWEALGWTCAINGGTFLVSDSLAQNVERKWATTHNNNLREEWLMDEANDAEKKRITSLGQGADFSGGRADEEHEVVLAKLTPEEIQLIDQTIGMEVLEGSKVKVRGIREVKSFSVLRMLRFGAVGALWGGPTTFARFTFIQMCFPDFTMAAAVGKVAVNQFVFSPILHGGVLLFNEWAKTGSFSRGWMKLRMSLFEVQLVTWATKVPLNFICFSLMPNVPTQALFMRTYDIFFYVYISYVADRDQPPEHLPHTSSDLDGIKEEGWEIQDTVPLPKARQDRTCSCCVM